jgi:hypothetical protein
MLNMLAAGEKIGVSKRVVLDLTLLAHANFPHYESLETDKDLNNVYNINPMLVLPLVTHKHVENGYWDGLRVEFNEADANLHDYEGETIKTAEVKIKLLKEFSKEYGGVDPVDLGESAAYVARNLSMKSEELTDAAVKAEVENILERRAEIGAEDILQRNVLLVSGDEVLGEGTGHTGELRFGKKALQDAIKARHQSSPIPLKLTNVDPFVSDTAPYQSTPESIAQAKSDAIRLISNSLEPLTVFFDGHGNPDFFALSAHPDDKTGEMIAGPAEQITVSEVADALTARYEAERIQGHSGLQISFVYDDCYMQNFARSLAAALQERNVPLPDLMISASEYGQYTSSDWNNPFGSRFNELIAKSPDLKTIMQQKHDVKVSDPSVFVPRKDDPKRLMQVSGIMAASFSAVG